MLPIRHIRTGPCLSPERRDTIISVTTSIVAVSTMILLCIHSYRKNNGQISQIMAYKHELIGANITMLSLLFFSFIENLLIRE